MNDRMLALLSTMHTIKLDHYEHLSTKTDKKKNMAKMYAVGLIPH